MKIRTSFFVLPTYILLVAISTNAFAICEHEQNELIEWTNRCEHLSAVATGLGTIGGGFAFFTFGASMAPFVAAAASASNACRIRDEKAHNLQRCQIDHEALFQAEIARQNASNQEAFRVAQEEINRARAEAQKASEIRLQQAREANERFAARVLALKQKFQRRRENAMKVAEERLSDEVEQALRNLQGTVSFEDFRIIAETIRVTIEQDRNQVLDEINRQFEKELDRL